MNAQRLYAIAQALQPELEELTSILSKLVQALQRLVAQPNDANAQANVGKARNELVQFLDQSVTHRFSPAWKASLKEFNVDYWLGEKLGQKVEKTFQANQVTPAVILAEINGLAEDVEQLSDATKGLINGLGFYEIRSDNLEPGECEVGFLIPRRAVDNQLQELGEEFEELNNILAPFSELACGSRPPITVRSISASDFGVYLSAAPIMCACFAKAVEWLINAYKGVLEIRKLRSDMVHQGMPKSSLVGVDTYADGVMETAIRDAVTGLLNEFGGNLDQHRKMEMKVELTVSLNSIANRIDKGYNVEVRAEPPANDETSTKDETDTLKYFNMIGSAQESLKFIHQDGESMLSLPTAAKDVVVAPTEPTVTRTNQQPKEAIPKRSKPHPKKTTSKKSKK